jgi:choline dehydrogenase-like flavoprotein
MARRVAVIGACPVGLHAALRLLEEEGTEVLLLERGAEVAANVKVWVRGPRPCHSHWIFPSVRRDSSRRSPLPPHVPINSLHVFGPTPNSRRQEEISVRSTETESVEMAYRVSDKRYMVTFDCSRAGSTIAGTRSSPSCNLSA